MNIAKIKWRWLRRVVIVVAFPLAALCHYRYATRALLADVKGAWHYEPPLPTDETHDEA